MPRCARCFGEVPDLAVFCPGCSQPHPPEFDQLLNRRLNERYQIYRRLDQGGLSAVFTAIDLRTDQIVVIKLSDPSHLTKRELTYALAADEARQYWAEMLERMRREAAALAQIRHRNIVRLYDTGTLHADLRYVVMEYLRGRTLREELAARQKLSLSEALKITLALADALQEIHSRGIVHRDLNPRNVMLCDETARPVKHAGSQQSQADIKLIDFGIAKFPQPPGAPPFTQHSILSGTVAYASPEQCQNQPIDQSTDLYSLGIVLYEMVTGTRPFTGRTPTEIALKQIQTQPILPRVLVPELPLSLETTILRALAKNPAERHSNIGEMSAELRAIAQRLVVALPVKQVTAPVPLLLHPATEPPANNLSQAAARAFSPSPLTNAAEQPIFSAFQPNPSSRRRQLACAAMLLLFLLSAAYLAKNRFGNAQSAQSDQHTLKVPFAVPSGSSPAESSESVHSNELPSVSESILPDPEAELAQTYAAFSPVQVWPRGKQLTQPRQAKLVGRTIAQPPASASIPAPPLAEMQIFNLPEIIYAPNSVMLPAVIADSVSAPEAASVASVYPSRTRRQREPANAWPVADNTASASAAESFNDSTDAHNDQPDLSRDFSPKIIAWSGAVRGERVIRLEMPGVPGRIEIPRSYRHRVGVVESPSLGNSWRRAVLRVFGQGECSIVLRWWPRRI